MRSLAKTIAVTLVASIIAFAICFRLEVFTADHLLVKYGNWQSPKDIVIVTIDENTLAKLAYRSPIDRSFLSSVIKKIDAAGPRAIGIDLLIDQASEADKDAAFFATLREVKNPIVVGYATMAEGLTKKQLAYQNAQLKGFNKGLVTLLRDNFDGIVRQVFIGRQTKVEWMPGLTTAIAQAIGRPAPHPSGRLIYHRDKTNKDTPFKFTTYPAHTVAFLPPAWFKDKIVLIGPALPSTDKHATPFTTVKGTTVGNLYGVLIHAHALSQILNSDQLFETGFASILSIVLTLTFLTALLATSKQRPLLRLLLIGLVCTAFVFLGIYLYRRHHIQIPMVTPVVAAVLAGLFFSFRQWFRDREQRQFIESAFSKYVSPAIVSKIVTNHQKLELGGELRHVTYIFTDLENFTSLSEGMEPAQIAALLNDYLDQMCNLFVEADATIDKIIGDAVVGFFGAPQAQDDQAERAVQLALKIGAFSQAYRQSQQSKGINFGNTRIGVHKGDAVIGNFGGKRFMDYTGIGDTVNTAARLEAANKIFGTRICISQSVVEASQHPYFRPIGNIQLKGKEKYVTCFEPLNPALNIERQQQAYKSAFELMAKNDPKATVAFDKLGATYPDDRLINFHATRLRQGIGSANIRLTEK